MTASADIERMVAALHLETKKSDGDRQLRHMAPSRPTAQIDPSDEAALQHVTKGHDFTLRGLRCLAKVVDVYDGDTVRVAFRWRGVVVQFPSRMAGYDSPEMRPRKADPNRLKEKAAALAARDALVERIGGELVIIECGDFDKYGRLLVTMYKRAGPGGAENGESLNAWMVAQKYGVPYDGGTKKAFDPSDVPGG